jgi:hypothetical protein
MEKTNPRDSLEKPIVRLLVHFRNILPRRIRLLGMAGACLFALMGIPAMAQTGTSLPPSAQKAPISLPHAYWHFFIYQNHLDVLAAQREQQGQDGSPIRNYFQRKLGFTDAQFGLVRSTAQRLQTEALAVDAQAKAFIDADRAVNPLPSTPQMSRTVPPELQAMQQQREDLIQSEISDLKQALGPELAARLENFMKNRVAASATASALHPSPTPDEMRQHFLEAAQKAKEAQQ